MNLSSESIKKKAIQLGFQKVGIVSADRTDKQKADLENWLEFGYHATMDWMSRRMEERGNILTYYPKARSIIAVGMNHDILKSGLFKLLSWIKENEPDVKGVVCVDTAPVMDKVWAQRAGLGWQGKHTNLISRDYGSWLFLGELILDVDLEQDSPFTEDLCGTCTACIDACPTHALDEYQINAGKCISYLTIEHRGSFPENQKDLNGWIYGCDICQEVCPWNERFSQLSHERSFLPRKEIKDYNNDNWVAIDEDVYRELFKGSSAKRTKFVGLKRNIEQNSNRIN